MNCNTTHYRANSSSVPGDPTAPFQRVAIRSRLRSCEVQITVAGESGRFVRVAVRRAEATGGIAATDRFSLHLLDAVDVGDETVGLLNALFGQLCSSPGDRVAHTVGPDAGFHSARRNDLGNGIDWRIGQCLASLRANAPVGLLSWERVALGNDGRSADVLFADPSGARVLVSVALRGETVVGSYKLPVPVPEPSRELVEGVRAVMGALRGAA